jgi:hypothetical protein
MEQVLQDKSPYARRRKEPMRASVTDDNAADDDLDAKVDPFIYAAILRKSHLKILRIAVRGSLREDAYGCSDA